MIISKTPQQIKIMAKGGEILSQTLWEVLGHIQPGVSELEIDTLAEKLIRKKGGEPGFQKVKGYKHTICISTNDVVVHGIPTAYKFKEGDVVGIDCGVFYKGFHTDMSETLRVSSQKSRLPKPGTGGQAKVKTSSFAKTLGDKQNGELDRFLETGKRALEEAIKQAVIGNRVGNISKVIQDVVEVQNGYSVVRSLVGHGIGKDLHEEPEVPGYLIGKIEKTPLLKEGMVIAVEIIYNMGDSELSLDDDNWTLRTKDGKLAGLYERTVAITKNGPLILTK